MIRSQLRLALLVVCCTVVLPNIVAADTFIAAMVEHQVQAGPDKNNATAVLNFNLDLYQKHMETAVVHNASIILYPEFGVGPVNLGLFSTHQQMLSYAEVVPDYKVGQSERIFPCTNISANVSPVLVRMSCMAAKYQILTQYTHFEIDSQDSSKIYVVTIMLSAEGEMWAKYRKYNPWWKNIIAKPELDVTIRDVPTLGASFGTFTCYDLLHNHPEQELLAKGVHAFLYQSAIHMFGVVGQWMLENFTKKHSSTLINSDLGYGGSAVYQYGERIRNQDNLYSIGSGKEAVLIQQVTI